MLFSMHGEHFNLHDLPHANALQQGGEDDNHCDLNLSLSLSPPLPLPPSPTPNPPNPNPTAPTQRRRQLLLPRGISETIEAPYPWATDRRARIRSLKDLVGSGIGKIRGKMKCKKCGKETETEYDLVEKLREVERFIVNNRSEMHQRAPEVWENPRRPDCEGCKGVGCVRPVMEKKRNINWLFLFLGQMIGFCSIDQLKYFCKHTRNHRTGAKDRLLYIAYLTLCNQLHPTRPYHL